ncbi:S8 family serine peptidase [Schleiferiaceae bacterium]|nr:S8 family serine peptidase [Schleiferiaceae bacterium]MDA9192013.1 S8 family serine peptidase [Schleiferiaceae bacterium]
MTRILLFLFTVTTFVAQAQLKVQLKSGTYLIEEGTFKQLSNTQPTYGVGLWDRVVLAEDKKALTDLGVELGHYLPKNAFEVKIPAGVTIADLRDAGLSAFVKWTPRMKLDGPLAIGDWPEWAVLNKGHVAIQFKTTENWKAPAYVSQVMDLDDEWHTAVLKPELLTQLSENNDVLFIQAIEEPGTPENDNSRQASRIENLQTNVGFEGAGVVIGIGDDGDIGPHIDYSGRLTSLAGASIGDHGDHVSGTAFGAGNIDPNGKGIAPASSLIYYSYPNNLSSIDAHYSSYGIRVTNSSYSNGCNAGYTSFSAQVDKDAIQHSALIHVFSAGNSGYNNCGYGAGNSWGTVTGGHKQGKNVVACGNLLFNDNMAGSSSRGPAADGRIKPDLCAIGSSVYSTEPSNTYGFKTGTSMSAPAVAGFFAVLHNMYDSLHNATADGGLLKAIAMNTADDLGNSGPDFIYGYGRVNAVKAHRVIRDSTFKTSTISVNDTNMHLISVPTGATNLKVMVYWTDPEASLNAAKALVNNIDIELEELSSSSFFKPWVLNPNPNSSTLNANAVRSVDTLNNIEQVTIENPNSGDYKLWIYGTNIPQGPQKYYVVIDYDLEAISIDYPVAASRLTPGSNRVRWSGSAIGLSWAYSTDSMINWTNLNLNPNNGNQVADWTIPQVSTANAFLRVIKGSDTSIVGPFVILNQPNTITLDWVCPDSLKVTASPVSGASSYSVFMLGNKYMDSVTTTSSNSIVISHQASSSSWLSVSGNINNQHGKRAYAIEIPSGLNSCPLPRDASVTAILGPNLVTSCHSTSVPVSIQINNPSTSSLDTVAVAYACNGTTVRDTLFASIAPYGDTTFTFAFPLAWSGTSNQNITVWSELSGDQNGLNDTVQTNITYLNSTLYGLPFGQNMNSFSNCSNATNCGGTTCSLGGNWLNLTNGSEDDIDWRTWSGSTQSAGTGPSSDVGGNGKYLYLESSVSCEFKEAELLSPCIDLSTAIAPELSFSYHMNGSNIGSLKVELFDGNQWHLLTSVSGSQGNSWVNVTEDLVAYAGDTIILRFTGTTGDGYQSDIAIDEVGVIDNIGVPDADFSASTTTPCLNTAIVLTDDSKKTPTSWNWSITPSTHSFVNGTSATSQNPEISFSAYGSYSITLIATNNYGSDTLVQTSYITASPLPVLPIAETWTYASNSDFTVINPDGGKTWTIGEVAGPTGAKSIVMYMGYYNYSSTGEVDYLRSPKFDVSGYSNPTLMFDISYAPYSSTYADTLAVLVSTDCGSTFDTLYLQGNADLATVSSSNSIYVPSGKEDWRTDTVALDNLASDLIQFQFMGVCGYGNNLYLDNIRVVDLSGTPSTATLQLPSTICEDVPFSFELTSTDTSLAGDFTLNRQGSSLTSTFAGLGAHNTTLNIASDYDLEYAYYNAYTFVADSAVLVPGPKLDAKFGLALTSGTTYQFTDQSTPAPTAWFWDFGDGTTSTAQNPVHTFAANGPTTVKLVVTTDCGLDSIIVPYTNIGLDEDGAAALVVYPNPTSGLVHIQPRAAQGKVMVQITGMNGALIEESVFTASTERITLDLGAYAGGFYQIKVTTDKYVQNVKITKY